MKVQETVIELSDEIFTPVDYFINVVNVDIEVRLLTIFRLNRSIRTNKLLRNRTFLCGVFM